MKPLMLFAFAISLLTSPVWGQAGFSYGREIIYPTEFDVQRQDNVRNRGGANQVSPSLPTVEPSGFVTRKTGAGVRVDSVAVTGKVNISRGANGREIAVLQPKNGPAIKVATGSVFKLNGHLLKALGVRDGQYMVYNMTNKKTYAFTAP